MTYEISPAFLQLRKLAFAFKDANAPAGSPSGVIMETGYPEGIVTLAVLSDGNVSLYFSNGGAVLGAGLHEGPAQAARRLGAAAARFAASMPLVTDTSPPERDQVKLYVLIEGGLRGAAGPQVDFGENRLPSSPLFHEAHKVIAAVRTMPRDEG